VTPELEFARDPKADHRVDAVIDAIAVLDRLLPIEGLWLDSTAAGLRVDATATDPKAAASKARREERIFAAWDGHHFHYPAFQFDGLGPPRPRTSELIGVLPRDRDGTVGLDAVLWVFAPDLAFDGKSPAELFATQPERVIAEARIRLAGGHD
jgi:hypothetical protein